ncbi:PREDICTED: cytochrome P450 71A26-like [Tarenaya hassleriana]|uniref:cytochrome P450 71A26-like n=1 Tax=Tarenaya hassleriana TaxID=28532 RepID=UPI00053C3F11|nr:PREDICTED: cytochrome P450 71A26-like [Tarenaya hassleriana]
MELLVAVSSILIIIVTVLLLNLLFKRTSSSTAKNNANAPPSPPGLPVIGNLLQLGRHPHRSLCSLSHRYGPLMLLHLGKVPVLVVSSADAARGVLKTYDLAFASRPRSKLFKKLLYDGRDVALAPYGEYWRQMKRSTVSNKMIRSFRNVREKEVKLMTEKIEKAASSSSPLNVSEIFTTLTNDVICRVALGRKYGGDVNFEELMRRFTKMLGKFCVSDHVPWLGWIDRICGLDDELEKIGNEFDEFLEGVVKDHLDGEGNTADFVDVLLEIQREKKLGFEIDMVGIKAIILDVFVGGTDTSSTLLEWAMTELMRHPESMNRLKEEVRCCTVGRHKQNVSEDGIHEMKYLKAVIKESLRLHPPLPLLAARESIRHAKFQGYDIPLGTQVMINAWAVGRETATWGVDAEVFRPERHLDSDVDFRGQDFKLVPFGAGRRICPGIAFAIAIDELALANAVHRFDWKTAKGTNEDRTGEVSESTGIPVHRLSPLIAFAHPT